MNIAEKMEKNRSRRLGCSVERRCNDEVIKMMGKIRVDQRKNGPEVIGDLDKGENKKIRDWITWRMAYDRDSCRKATST